MALTLIEDGMLTDSILTASKLNTTGTASSTTVLKGDFSWGTGASTSGKWNVAASAPGTPVAGDIWYTGGIVYIAVSTANTSGAWSTTSNLTTGFFGDDGFGLQAAGVVAGGSVTGGATDRVEEYNGLIWAAGTTLPTVRARGATAGIATAGWFTGGRAGPAPNLATTLEYDGTSWTSGGDLITGRYELGCAGTVTSGLAIAGEGLGPVGYLDTSEEYDGTTWTAGGNLVQMDNKGDTGVGATQSAAIVFGGANGGPRDITEEYDGTCWSVAMKLDRARVEPGGFGTKTAAICAGGDVYPDAPLNTCLEWNYEGQFNIKNVGYS